MKSYVLIEKYRERKCSKCENTFPATFEFFHKDNSKKNKLRYDCQTCSKKRSLEYKHNHKEEVSAYSKIYINDNKERELKRKREWYHNNKVHANKLTATNRKIKRHTDSFYKLTINIRNLIKNSLKKQKVSTKNRTYEILGCTYEEFKIHIENQFLPWMNWNNYGKYNGEFNSTWNYDHIIPLSSATNEGELIKLNYYTNFQPLCSKINQDIKGDKLNFKLEF